MWGNSVQNLKSSFSRFRDILGGLKIYKSWLTAVDRATRCVTPNCHAVHKTGCWVWSIGDGRRSTVDNTWRRSTCVAKLFRGSETAPEGITFIFGDIRISYLFDKYSPALGDFSLDQKLWIQWRHDPGPIHWLEIPCKQWLHRSTTLK